MSSPSERLADLLIVGAGILGLSAAIQAANAGLRVIIFERNVSPVGATRRNFGMIGTSTLTHPSGIWRQYALESRKFYQEIQAETNISFQQRDGLYLANTDEEWQVLQEFANISPDHAIPSQLLSNEHLAEDYQYLDADRLKGGLLLSEDYSVEPGQIGHSLLNVARAHHNIRVLTQSCVTQVKSAENHVSLKLADGQYFSAKKMLITHGDVTDILYPDVLKQAGLKRCTLQMAKTLPFHQSLNASLYSGLSIRRYPAFEICPSFNTLTKAQVPEIVDAYGIHILIKQTADGGLIIGDSHEYHSLDEPPQFHQRETLNRFILDYCHDQLGIKLPAIQERWNGYYLTHPTELVFVAEPDPNIHIISTIAGKGMTTGPGFMINFIKNSIL
ncbi:TIGR03364 family FAD-dependent oxidoreductase [Aquirhabdus parva]|uniref:TIGR03364 family FAD-dependent oxidoreductase n=1 Tax=Aquirhabdus parva TaxID=2283318 RepID=A0A345P5S4_9GAMM|nr:TIGR03364 family FAD-dependent oxidoreductase [Aquirhabdus parva]AXI02633.1 TIGR03364 family FAD-dependent oxidoreductase [Aquirhabdus parva]